MGKRMTINESNGQLRYENGRRIWKYERDKETREIMYLLS
jgi:hypothetical protein